MEKLKRGVHCFKVNFREKIEIVQLVHIELVQPFLGHPSQKVELDQRICKYIELQSCPDRLPFSAFYPPKSETTPHLN